MMTAQHTPGPWTANRRYVETKDQTICEIFGGNREDARLIAAAPDLLAELKNLRRAYVSLLETGRDRIIQHGGQCDSVEVMEKADPYLKSSSAAIAKATGEIHG